MKDAKMNTKVVSVHSSEECNTFDVVNDDGVILAYFYQHLTDPVTNKVLQTPVFEIYYDYDGEKDYDSSLLSEDFDDIVDIIDSLE